MKKQEYTTEYLTELLKEVLNELDLKTVKEVQDLTGKPSTSIRASKKYPKITLFNNKQFIICKDLDL